MLANDDLNFYVEKNNPNNNLEYKTENGFLKYDLIEKTIKIKNETDTTFVVKVSKHGPIMNGLVTHINDERPIAMNWIYTQLENKTLDVAFGMSHATSFNTFKNSVEKIHAPGLNVMYGDAKNNIAWFASAKLYQLREGVSSKLYLEGASGDDEILEILPFDENPKAINPSSNYVYSANHQPDSVRGKLYPGYYQPEDRSKRIVTLLEVKNNFTKQDVAKMTYDVTSSVVPEIAANLLKSVDFVSLNPSQKKAFEILKNWKGIYVKDAIGPTIYNRFLYEFLVATYKDEIGNQFDLFINSQLQDQVLTTQLTRENSVWWDDISTKNKVETKEEIITASFKKGFKFLENQLGTNVEVWTWDRVISVEHEHAIGKAGGVLRSLFNVGPFKTIGGNEVINNQIFKLDSTGIYKVTAGPSTRRVIDFSDVENSLSILPTGQSGSLFSKHYKDQTEKYLNGQFIKMKLNQKEIENSKNVLVLKPKKE
ncbi:penicillin acylase family protein, partial [Polaribacter sp.]|uniref:penicillin acylase family protein n=1 Tax=Polaribacter sp. TaxID=1920175 RepID=UPI003F6B49FC